ncbi:MAG: hypothetical protein IPH03_09070 [Tetrasphaera sp.]|nr:hypothetical protein [Tetrasphaera sp.]
MTAASIASVQRRGREGAVGEEDFDQSPGAATIAEERGGPRPNTVDARA